LAPFAGHEPPEEAYIAEARPNAHTEAWARRRTPPGRSTAGWAMRLGASWRSG
jgi:hypothetical protein